MSITPLRKPASTAGALRKATVRCIHDDGSVDVQTEGDRGFFSCDVVHPLAATGRADHSLEVGDRILVAPPQGDDARGCVLGTLGRPRTPPVLHLNAGEEIHLVCGKGSVRLRSDGVVIVRGLEVASIAEGVNRIKGGSVEVN